MKYKDFEITKETPKHIEGFEDVTLSKTLDCGCILRAGCSYNTKVHTEESTIQELHDKALSLMAKHTCSQS